MPKGLYTEEELASAGKVVIMTTLKKGSSGEAVVQLQEWLNALGYSVGTVDGRFGGKTYTAVQQFQMDHGLTADGIVGALTWNAIEEAVGKDKPAEDEETVPDTPEDAGDSGTDDEEIAGILATVQEMEKEIASVADLIRELKQRISAINAVG